MSVPTTAVILAAGMGTRMKSRLPKVLHAVAGRPMVHHVVEAARGAGIGRIVVIVGHGAEAVRESLPEGIETADQVPQLGSADAVAKAGPLVGSEGTVVVLNGDIPLIRAEAVSAILEAHRTAGATLTAATFTTDDPHGYGRIIRSGDGTFVAIREEPDASDEERAIREVNGGLYAFKAAWLWDHLPKLPKSAKDEYYITDLVAMASTEHAVTLAVPAADPIQLSGINNRVQLAEAEAILRNRIRHDHMHAGVTIVDPATTYIDAGVPIGMDTVIHPGTWIQAGSAIGEECAIGPNTIIRNASIGDRCRVLASVVEDSLVGNDVGMGPWCRVRGGAILDDGVDMGNYAEIKKSHVGSGTKMHHFGYLGDASVGHSVNIGAGTITCNYDGVHKNRTTIGNGAFIGSDTMLVAPVEVGEEAVTGAGTVVTKDVPPGMLAVGVPARNLRRIKRQKDSEDGAAAG